jgi:HlyD family secretion protein
MARSIAEEQKAPTGGETAPTPRALAASPIRAGIWNRLTAHGWRIGIGLLVTAGIATLVYGRLFAPVEVRSQEVTSGEIVAEVMGTGTLATHVKVTISTNITGLLSEVLADQGDQVKAGQVLARLDDRDLQRQVNVEEANVSARKATVDRLMADRNSAKSMLELSTKSYERVRELIGKNAIAQEEYDIR